MSNFTQKWVMLFKKWVKRVNFQKVSNFKPQSEQHVTKWVVLDKKLVILYSIWATFIKMSNFTQ